MTIAKAATLPANKHEVEVIERIVDAILDNKSRPIIASLNEAIEVQKQTIKSMDERLAARDANIRVLQTKIEAQAATIKSLTTTTASAPVATLSNDEIDEIDEIDEVEAVAQWQLDSMNNRITRLANRLGWTVLLAFANLAALGYFIYSIS